jgi:hypothetical protein
MAMASIRRVAVPTLGAVFAVAAGTVVAPNAYAAGMAVGNYEVANDRWNDHSWVWRVTHSCNNDPECGTYIVDPILAPASDNLNVIAIARPLKSQRFQNTAFYADGRYTLTVDVIDGVRCIGYNLPSHDVYNWDAATLTGTIVSTYDAGCYGAPGGASTYTFSLIRL